MHHFTGLGGAGLRAPARPAGQRRLRLRPPAPPAAVHQGGVQGDRELGHADQPGQADHGARRGRQGDDGRRRRASRSRTGSSRCAASARTTWSPIKTNDGKFNPRRSTVRTSRSSARPAWTCCTRLPRTRGRVRQPAPGLGQQQLIRLWTPGSRVGRTVRTVDPTVRIARPGGTTSAPPQSDTPPTDPGRRRRPTPEPLDAVRRPP